MAGNFSTNLGLPALPIDDDPTLFTSLLPIHRAIQGLQIALDQYTGILAQPQEAWSTIPPQNTLIASNLFRMYRPFAVNVTGGQMVGVDTSGNIVLAGAATGAPKCRGFSTGAVTAGQFGEVITFGGTITFAPGTLVIGATYYLSNTPGLISTAPGTNSQAIGFAITTDILVFQPVTV